MGRLIEALRRWACNHRYSYMGSCYVDLVEPRRRTDLFSCDKCGHFHLTVQPSRQPNAKQPNE